MADENSWDQLIEHWDGRLRRAFLEAVQHIADQAHIEQIVRMLQHDDYEGALKAVGLDPALFRVWNKTFEDAFEAGGIATASGVPTRYLDRGFRVKFQFDVRNPLAENWLRTYSSNLIAEVMDGQRQMIRNFLTVGMQRGQNPRTVALSLVGKVGADGKRTGGVLGLTDSQANWVAQYADDLANDPAKALTRTLRDKRFDPVVKRALASGEPIAAETRQKMVTAYTNRALRYRAETIARTEAMVALHQSQETAMRLAIQAGAVDRSQVSFVWRTAHDNRVRDSHQPMDGQVRAIGNGFRSGNGRYLLYPGDPAAPPEETINCRCWREPKVDFLAGIR